MAGAARPGGDGEAGTGVGRYRKPVPISFLGGGQAEDCQVCLEAGDGDEVASQQFALHVPPLA